MSEKKCRCGCGISVQSHKRGNKRLGIVLGVTKRTYVAGHNTRGKKRSESAKKRTSRTLLKHWSKRVHPTKGKKMHSDATKKKIGIASRNHWKDPSYRKVVTDSVIKRNNDPDFRNRMEKVWKSDEFKKFRSEKSKLQWRNPDYRKRVITKSIGRKDVREKVKRIRLTQVFPFEDSSLEVTFQNALRNNQVSFTTHKPIVGQPDIFIEPNLCIFLDGCYWHGCKKCLDEVKLRDWIKWKNTKDRSVNKALEEKGYRVLRFWEHEVNSDTAECIKKVEELSGDVVREARGLVG